MQSYEKIRLVALSDVTNTLYIETIDRIVVFFVIVSDKGGEKNIHFTSLIYLEFVAVAEVTSIAETRYDVLVLVETLVDSGAPDGGLVVREGILDVLDALRSGKHASHMDVLRVALGEDGLQSHLHADASGKHRVGDDERLALNLWCGEILDVYANLSVVVVGILTISADKGIARMVENIEKTFMERKTGTENSTNDNLVGREIDICHTKRCRNFGCFVIEVF